MEDAREVEFGCPSMHVALVVVMNGYAVHLVLQRMERMGGLGWPGLCLLVGAAITWVGVIAWGRLYLVSACSKPGGSFKLYIILIDMLPCGAFPISEGEPDAKMQETCMHTRTDT
jgi:hypothetical protein